MQIEAQKAAEREVEARAAAERAEFVRACDVTNGLTEAQAATKLVEFGPNVLDEKKRCVCARCPARQLSFRSPRPGRRSCVEPSPLRPSAADIVRRRFATSRRSPHLAPS